MENNSLRTLTGVDGKTDVRAVVRCLRRGVSIACAFLALTSCGSGAKDTLAPLSTDAGTPTVVGAGPIAVAAASSEAALEAQRAEAARTLKAFAVTFTIPGDLAGEVKADTTGASCAAPGTVPEGGPYELAYTSSKNAKVTAFSAKTQGTYEGPGNYSANFTWTGSSGAKTGTGTIFVYSDEESGEFSVEGSDPLAGTWQCEFKK